MIALIAGNLARFIPARLCVPIAWLLVGLVAFLAVREVGVQIYNRGVYAERAAWVDAGKAVDLARIEARLRAEARDAPIAAAAQSKIEQDRKDLDHATATLPDRPLTDRQRARADGELRRRP